MANPDVQLSASPARRQAGEDIGYRLTDEQAGWYNASGEDTRKKVAQAVVTVVKPAPAPAAAEQVKGGFFHSDLFKLPAVAILSSAITWGIVHERADKDNDQPAEEEQVTQSCPAVPPEEKLVLSQPFHVFTTAMLQIPKDGNKQEFTAPLEYFHRKNDGEIVALFQRMSDAMPYLPIDQNFTAFAADNSWQDDKTGIYRNQVIIFSEPQDALLQTDAARDIIAKAIRKSQDDAKAHPNATIAYRFNITQANETVTPPTPAKIDVVRDIDADKEDKGKPGDMEIAYSYTFE